MDEFYMSRAIELAKKGTGYTSPNPMVGCVIVKEGEIIGEGHHERYGELHAERNALHNCRASPEGATLYVTLEPCCHHGKTLPCTDAIIGHKIKRVVVGAVDENPLVGGKGIKILQDNGIEVKIGIMEKECRVLNEIFFHFIKYNEPFTALKYAVTLDGNIAAGTGDSKWVTGHEARAHVHMLRGRYRGIMIGIETLLQDNPMLNCRGFGGLNPVRIICDSTLRIPLDCRIADTAKEITTIVAYANGSPEKCRQLEHKGICCVPVPDRQNRVDLTALVQYLGKMKIDSLLVEGGGILNGALLEAGLIHKVYAYLAPKLMGGSGKHPIAGPGVDFMSDAYELEEVRMQQLGIDYLVEGNLKRRRC